MSNTNHLIIQQILNLTSAKVDYMGHHSGMGLGRLLRFQIMFWKWKT